MRVRQKGAIFMLAILMLWAALPGLDCLAPASQDQCCQQMMQDCGPSMAMSDASCCKVHSTDTNLQPSQPSAVSGADLRTYTAISSDAQATSLDAIAVVHTAETPPGSSSLSRSSILRI